MEQNIINDQYIIHKKIGGGSFGEIYSGENIKTHRKLAIKLERTDCKIPQLCYEAKLYNIMQGGLGIASIYWYGSSNEHNALVIDKLGKSLEKLFKECNSHFSLKTVLMLADQMISCIEYFHQKNYIHRDIKPDNFVMGLGSKSNQVFMIDFGLAKRYRDTCTHKHIEFSSGYSLTGTARYSSLNALKGFEQSRRDDLESLGYVLLYFLRGNLPWMGKMTQNTGFNYQMITKMKAKISFEDLVSDFPDEFIQYFYLVRNLEFAEKPNYSFYRKIFRDLFIKSGFIYDNQYDWINTSNVLINQSQTDSNIILHQNIVSKNSLKEQQSNPNLELHKKPKKKVISSKSESIIKIKENEISSIKNSLTSRNLNPKKLIENPYYKKKKSNQQDDLICNHKQVNIVQQNYHSPEQKLPTKLKKNLEYTGKLKIKS